jgi:hypothetical protein
VHSDAKLVAAAAVNDSNTPTLVATISARAKPKVKWVLEEPYRYLSKL